MIFLGHVGLNDPRATGRVATALGEAAYKQAYEISIGYFSRAPTRYNKTEICDVYVNATAKAMMLLVVNYVMYESIWRLSK